MFLTSPSAINSPMRGSFVAVHAYQATSCALTSGVLPLVSSGGSCRGRRSKVQDTWRSVVIGGAPFAG